MIRTACCCALALALAACTTLDDATAPVELALAVPSPLSGYSAGSGWDQTHLWSVHSPPAGWSDIRLADLDGDGRDDLCGFFGDVFGCAIAGKETFHGWIYALESYAARTSPWAATVQVVDVDGDGRSEICGRTAIGLMCSVWDGLVDVSTMRGVMTTSYDDDGARDVLVPELTDAAGWARPEYQLTIAYPRLRYPVAGPRAVCARGRDGIACWYHDVARRTAVRGPSAPEFSDALGWNRPEYYRTLQFVDVTGDGHDDVCGRGPAGLVCAAYDPAGRRFLPARLWTTAFRDASGWNNPIYYASMRFADLDGDARADVCARGRAGVYCALSDGARFVVNATPVVPAWSDAAGWSGSAQYYGSLMLTDLDGDRRADACAVGPGAAGAEVFCAYSRSSAAGAAFDPVPFRRTTGSGFTGAVRVGRIRFRTAQAIVIGEFCAVSFAAGDVRCTNV